MGQVIVKGCSCKHEYQDEKYGKQQRVHNAKQSKGKVSGWACTVCSKEKPLEFGKD